MLFMILGLLLFLGMHTVRAVAEPWRTRMIARLGANGWRALYSALSLIGLVLMIWGFRRAQPVVLYTPPAALRHLNALFTLIAFVLVTAAYVPRNHLKAAIGHPMVAGVKAWAFGHLLATGWSRDVVLFGAFLLWAIIDFAASRRRDRRLGTRYPAGTLTGDVLSIVIGIAAWAVFAFWLHAWLIGVNPFA
jgi:uncharacterized membrane protein